MTKKTTLIFMSHGNMAKETLASAQMIVGEMGEAAVISMLAEDGLSGTTEKLEKILNDSNKEDSILIIADLKGGTPCNVAMMKMQDYPNLRVITGLNLALAIEALMSTETDVNKLIEFLVPVGKESVGTVELPELDDDEEYEE